VGDHFVPVIEEVPGHGQAHVANSDDADHVWLLSAVRARVAVKS
jgi:hypothetical protein